jgi:hypothetical protein
MQQSIHLWKDIIDRCDRLNLSSRRMYAIHRDWCLAQTSRDHTNNKPARYSPPRFTTYTNVYVPRSMRHLMGLVIGKEGRAFKAITHVAHVDSIWYNGQVGLIEVWANQPARLAVAEKLLQDRMALIGSKQVGYKATAVEPAQ